MISNQKQKCGADSESGSILIHHHTHIYVGYSSCSNFLSVFACQCHRFHYIKLFAGL